MMDPLFYRIFESLPRQGPGNAESARKAFLSLGELSPQPRILDIGCGSGAQTLELARLCSCDIIAMDQHQPFLDILQQKAVSEGLERKIHVASGDMFSLNLAKKSFDLIWSEGAIYIIGFEQGLREWKEFLTPKGYMAVTDISWLKNDPPKEIRDYWAQEYPGIMTDEEHLSLIESCGYRLMEHFILPESAWWDDFYTPMESRIKELWKQYAGNEEAQKILDSLHEEIDLYRNYSDCYGYVFYIIQGQ